MKNKNPWEDERTPWKTEKSFWSWVNNRLRIGLWKNHPVKKAVLNKRREKLPLGKKTKPNPKGLVWGYVCPICNGKFRPQDVQVDHITAAGSMVRADQLEEFITSLIFVSEEDLQILCKECHSVKTYSERYDVNFEKAKTIKEVIKRSNQKTSVQKKELLSLGFTEDQISNQKKRRECYESYFGL